MCSRIGHAANILEVHDHKDLIRCSRCNKIQRTFNY